MVASPEHPELMLESYIGSATTLSDKERPDYITLLACARW